MCATISFDNDTDRLWFTACECRAHQTCTSGDSPESVHLVDWASVEKLDHEYFISRSQECPVIYVILSTIYYRLGPCVYSWCFLLTRKEMIIKRRWTFSSSKNKAMRNIAMRLNFENNVVFSNIMSILIIYIYRCVHST